MPIIYRYLLTHFSSMFFIVAPGLIGIFVLVDAFEHLDEFVEANVPMTTAGLYFLLKLPGIFYELSPLILLLSGLLTIALLSRHTELLALRSVGVRPGQVLTPLLAAALLICTLTFVLKAFYVPKAVAEYQEIWRLHVKHDRPKGLLREGKLVYHGKNCIWTTKLGSPDATVLTDVWWLQFDGQYRARRILAAPVAEYQEDRGWTFKNGVELALKDQEGYVSTPFETRLLRGQETPKDFVSVEIPPEELDLPSLWKGVARMKKLGFPSFQQETLLWSNILYPFLGVSLLALGLPLTLSAGRWGVGAGLGLGVIMGFVTWSFWSFILTLGNTGTLPGPVAPFLMHACLLGAGVISSKRLRF